MKKNCSLPQKSLFVSIILLVIQQSIRSQVPESAEWKTFINSVQNVSVQDTFRMQSFDETIRDNWTYTASKGTAIFETSKEDLEKQRGAHFLKILPGGYVYFEHYSLSNYKDVSVNIRHRGKNINTNDVLWAKTYRDPENKGIEIYREPSS